MTDQGNLFVPTPAKCACSCGCVTMNRDGSGRCTACALKLCGGEKLKEQAQANALAAHPEWGARAMREVERLARCGIPFTSEDVVLMVGLPTGKVATNKNNAVGALITSAAKHGLIVKTGRYVPSKRRRSHGAALAEWRGR